ncbi:MAG: protein kinase [Muribaculaceae bacterium]|nr:protein kinase [Muribaculaceae bacterium]MDE5968429.1 protein kinase [Muribaculaceae bacterium]
MSQQSEPAKPAAPQERWTEQERLPEWEETFYDVWTAKKHGKWVMLKTLKPEYAEQPEYKAMIEKEFDVRYNLAHPNIVMINDFEDVPGIGRCIITDDVYGDSLRKLLDNDKLTEEHLTKLITSLVEAMDYIQVNHLVHHPIKPETILFTENIGNLKLIDVGFDQLDHLSHSDTSRDIEAFGYVLREALAKLPNSPRHRHLQRVADRCISPNRRYRDVQDLKMALSDSSNHKLYIVIISFLSLMAAVLAWLLAHPANPITE